MTEPVVIYGTHEHIRKKWEKKKNATHIYCAGHEWTEPVVTVLQHIAKRRLIKICEVSELIPYHSAVD